MKPRNIEALTFLDEKIARHLVGRSDKTPSAEGAWEAMRVPLQFTGGKKPYRLGGGGPAYFLVSQREAIIIANLEAAPPKLKLIRPVDFSNDKLKKPSPMKTMMTWIATQPAEAYPLLIYVQDKAVDDGLLSCRLSHSPSAIHYCHPKEAACFDLTRILAAKTALHEHAPESKNWRELAIYLGLEDRMLSDKRLKKIEAEFGDMPEEAQRLIPAIDEIEHEFMSAIMSDKETFPC